MFPPALPNTPEGTINFSKVPRYMALKIGQTFLEEVVAFKRQPGGKEYLEAKVKEMKKRGEL